MEKMESTQPSTKRSALFTFFKRIHIDYHTVEHPALFTVADGADIAHTIPGAHTKNLFLKDDHKQYWLISALQETTIHLRALAKYLPAKNLRFARQDALKTYLDVEPGSVTWFALFNDKHNQVNAILDEAIFSHDLVGFHPLENTATTIVKPNALIQFADALDHPYQLLELASIT